MNKKFLSAIMCGALLTASTSVFVSCEDYGDDIAHLQEQIDQNAATAASDLAAKVAALESQLSTLKAAQDGMKEQLAAAKAEAATAANNAMLAAQAAQAAADKAQGGADDAKAAAAAAQATADAAAKNLADAVARVANLEGKIELLQGTINELSASNKELNTKLADLQLAFNSLSATVGTNSKEIDAVKADLAAKVADLTAQIATVSATIGGQIDAINAELNSIKANYATKGELSEVAANLAAVSTKLEGQIATNNAYVAEMEKVIAGLEAKDAAAAALIAANNEATLAEIAKINETLAAQKAAVDAEFENVKAQIADIEATVAQLAQLATANYGDIAAVRQALEEKTTEIFDLISQLTVADRGILEQLEIIFESIADVTTTANDNADLIAQLIGADKGFAADIEKILVNLDALNTSAADAADQIAQLIGADKGFADQIEALLVDYTQNKEEVADLISQLIGADRGFASQIEELLVDYTQNKEEVADLISQLIGADKGMAAQIEALLVDYDQHKIDAEELISQLAATDRGLASQIEELLVDYDAHKAEVADLISQLAVTDRGLADQIEILLVNADSINGVTSELAAQIAKLFAADEVLNGEIEKLIGEDAKLNAAIEGVKASIVELQAKDDALAGQIEAILAETKVLGGDLATAKDAIAALQTASEKAAADIVKLFGLLTDKDAEIGQINLAIENLKNLVDDNNETATAALEGLAADIKAIKEWKSNFMPKYAETIQGIYDDILKLTAKNVALTEKYDEAVANLQGQIDEVKANVEALFSRLQSVVFIPKYKDVNNVVITPIYAYTAETYDAEGEPMDVPAIFKVNFRVKPASLVSDFVAMANNGEALVNIYVEEALKNLDTRAADKESIQVINIAQDENDAEVITVTATAPRLNTELNETAYFPATLVISAENSKSEFTTEYFNLVERSLDAELPGVLTIKEGVELEIPYVDIDANRNVLEEVEVSYSDAINNVYGQDLYLFGGVDKDGNYVALSDEFVTWAATKGFALKDGLLSAATVNGVAMHHCIGETLTLIVADATYGYDADGLPNVSYEVTYELTAATADETIVFETVTKTWAGAADSEAFTLSTTTDLVDFTVEGVTVATKKELAAELAGLSIDKFTWTNTAVCSDFYLAYDQTNATVTINYNFAAGTDYNAEGEIAFTAETKYGKVNFKGAIKLAYPEASTFLAHEPRFNAAGDFIVEAGNQVLATAYRDGLCGSSLPAAYTYYAANVEAGAVYTFTYTGATDAEINLNTADYLTILSELANEEGVEITATVTIDGNVVATETYGIDVLYPVEGRNLKLNGASINDNMQTIDAATLYGQQTVPVIENVYLDDRYNNVLVKNGEFVARDDASTNASVWGITGLTYSLKKAYTETTQRTVTSVSVDENGNLSIVDPNIAENIIVEVEVKTVGYTYGVVDGTFKVLIEKTYGEYPASVE